jgi:hypothetical protein
VPWQPAADEPSAMTKVALSTQLPMTVGLLVVGLVLSGARRARAGIAHMHVVPEFKTTL